MADKTETKTTKPEEKGKIERIYVIPLRKKVSVVPRYKKSNKAIKTIKEFVARHMKIRDRDLKKVKVDEYVNEYIWSRGIKKPPRKVKVKVTQAPESNEVQVWLVDYPKKLKFKKEREDKIRKEAEEAAKKKAAEAKAEEEAAKKAKESETPEESEEKKEKKAEEKEKKASVVEATQKMEKAAAKKAKHASGGKTKQPKHQQRKALAK